MKLPNHRIAFLAAMAGCALLTSGAALAGNTNTLKVTASITGTCNFDVANNAGGNATLDFGALDQTLTTDAAATQTSLDYWCTNGTTATSLSADNGLNFSGTRRLFNGGTGYIPYTLTVTDPGGPGSGKSNPITVTFDGDITNADYIDAPAGTYGDTVTLTIAP
jgi:spore coat protein U-like protein